jgi:hypothetical protein
MRDDSWQESVGKFTLTLQVFVAALVAGHLFFLAIVLLVVGVANHPPGLFTAMAAALTCAILIARAVVPRVLVAAARRQILAGTFRVSGGGRGQRVAAGDDAHCLLAVFQQKTIVGAAMLEGCAFFATIAYHVEGSLPSLGLAVALLLGVAAHFPTQARVTDWVGRQLELLEQERIG